MEGLVMDGHISVAPVPVSAAGQAPRTDAGCEAKRSLFTGRTKWFLIAAIALVAAGLALGSGLLAASALLPLLYVLPCLVMMGMCMKAHGKGGAPTDSNSG